MRLHGIVRVHIDAMPTIGSVEPVGVDAHRAEVRPRAGALLAVGELGARAAPAPSAVFSESALIAPTLCSSGARRAQVDRAVEA